MRPVLLLPAVLGLAACVVFESPRPCRREAQAHLDALDIPPSDINNTTLRATALGAETTRFTGHALWVDLKSCRGHVVLEMRPSCELRRVYATRDCAAPGQMTAGGLDLARFGIGPLRLGGPEAFTARFTPAGGTP